MRPRFHFTAEHGWVNDPHGITFREGRYELFYQYVPDTMVWAPDCNWGHATSADLIAFDHLPIALAPGDGDDGIWTGSLVTDDAGRPTIFYTSVQRPGIGIGRVRTAHPDDDSWLTWSKGPVVVERPAELDIVAYRDPFVFRDGDVWRMFVGTGFADGTAAALSYSSADLASWAYDGVAVQRSTSLTEPVWAGALWECPQLFEIDGRHVMVTSVWDDDVLHYTAYAIGSYRDGRFEPEVWGRLSYGPSYYAPSFFRDADGRASLTFWLRGIKDEAAQWVGAHSVPHTLRLEGDTLVAAPHTALVRYRDAPAPAGRVEDSALDAVWSKGTMLTISGSSGTIASVTRSGAALELRVGEESWSMPDSGGPARVIVDGPVLELSADSGVLAAAIAPSESLTVRADGALEMWALSMPKGSQTAP